jgi:hypothetical protein
MSFESEERLLTVHGDFNGEAEKRRAVFLASLLTPGSTLPNELDPRNFEDIKVHTAGDVVPEAAARLCQLAHVEIDIR